MPLIKETHQLTRFYYIISLLVLAQQGDAQHFYEQHLYLDASRGLAQNHIFSSDQDPNGFMWFCTMGGLSKFDGFEFTSFLNKPEDTSSLSSNHCYDFLVDSRGRYWVSTINGLNELNRKHGTFKRMLHESGNENSIGHNNCRHMVESPDSAIWIVHAKGVDRFDPVKMQFEHFEHPDFKIGRNSGDIRIDPQGKIWVGGSNGLYLVNLHDKKLNRFISHHSRTKHEQEITEIIIASNRRIYLGTTEGLMLFNPSTEKFFKLELAGVRGGVTSLLEYPQSVLIIGTNQSGIHYYDLNSNKIIKHEFYNPANHTGLQGDNIYSLFLDIYNNLWVGMFNGINVIFNSNKNYQLLQLFYGVNNVENTVLMICEDRHGNYILNTVKGLYKVERKTLARKRILFAPFFIPEYKSMFGLFLDSRHDLYSIIHFEGLFKYNEGKNIMELFDSSEVFKNLIYESVFQDKFNQDRLIVPSQGGILYYNKHTKDTLWVRPTELDTSFKVNNVIRASQDKFGNLYFLSNRKLARYDVSNHKCKIINRSDTLNISGEIMNVEYQDSMVWVATTSQIYKYDIGRDQLSRMDTVAGLDKHQTSFLSDLKGNPWIARNDQIAKYDPNTGKFVHYSIPELKGFIIRKTYRARDGRLMYSASNGCLIINPENFKRDTIVPNIFLRDIRVLGKSIETELQKEYVKSISIPYEDKSFSIHFSTNRYNRIESIRYKCKLIGFNDEWIDNIYSREKTYTNLSPGDYEFIAIAYTEDGIESESPLRLKIQIKAPFYMTTAFYLLVAVVLFLLIYLYYKLNARTIDLKNKRDIAEKNAKYKSMFMANMSHEIRTPMNAILGLNKLLLDTKLDDTQKRYVDAIHSSSENLLFIINDILDQAKLESGKYVIVKREFNLDQLIHQLKTMLEIRTLEKGLKFDILKDKNVPVLLISDSVRLFQVLLNLLSNAIKFTDHGTVLLRIEMQSETIDQVYLKFSVEDTGIGIPENKVKDVFESFEQIHEKELIGNQGTGLGLSISKHLVELMGGHIDVKSKHGEGSKFYFELNMDKVDLSKKKSATQFVHHFRSNIKVLLVEDTPLNQLVATELLKRNLPEVYIETAENGQLALGKCSYTLFDIILMDVRMPVLDGIQATKIIKSDPDGVNYKTPIIGLTANAISEQINECIEAGMADYVTKPIDSNELFQKIHNLIK